MAPWSWHWSQNRTYIPRMSKADVIDLEVQIVTDMGSYYIGSSKLVTLQNKFKILQYTE